MAAMVASMATLVPIIGGYFLLLLHPCFCCSTSSRFNFPKERSGKGVSFCRKVIIEAMMLISIFSLV
jgi:hypothetical protein